MSQTSSKLSPESVAISAASADAVCVTERANLALIGFARAGTTFGCAPTCIPIIVSAT